MGYTFTTKFMKAAVGNFLEITFGNNCLKHQSSWQEYMKQKEKGLELHWKMSVSSKKRKKKLSTTVHSPKAREMTEDEINVEKIRIQKSKKLFNFSVRLHLFRVL